MKVSSIFVGRGTGVGVDLGVGFGVDVGAAVVVGFGLDVAVGVGFGVEVGVGAGVMLSIVAEGVGDDSVTGEVSFCGGGVLVGVADSAAFNGVGAGVSDFAGFDAVGVGDLCAADGEDFDLAAGVGVRLGEEVCALRSTPR